MNTLLRVFQLKLVISLLLSLLISGVTTSACAKGGGRSGPVSVNGYYRSNGTYVAPHMRSAPDGNFNNNWSTVGNVNPYTGEEGKKTTPTGSGGSVVDGNLSATPTLVAPAGVQPGEQNSPEQSTFESSPAPSQHLHNPRPNSSPRTREGMPANAELDYTGRAWHCRRGFTQRGSECLAVSMPANAELDYTGRSWQCRRGFTPYGSECLAVSMPANAELDYTGRAWQCRRGYRLQSQQCLPV